MPLYELPIMERLLKALEDAQQCRVELHLDRDTPLLMEQYRQEIEAVRSTIRDYRGAMRMPLATPTGEGKA